VVLLFKYFGLGFFVFRPMSDFWLNKYLFFRMNLFFSLFEIYLHEGRRRWGNSRRKLADFGFHQHFDVLVALEFFVDGNGLGEEALGDIWVGDGDLISEHVFGGWIDVGLVSYFAVVFALAERWRRWVASLFFVEC
jgi:hypothetical protein